MKLYTRIASRMPDHARAEVRKLCGQLEREATHHIALQTERANGIRRSAASYALELGPVERALAALAAKLPGGPWRVEFQGRGGGLCVVLALVVDPDQGDGLGGGWNIGSAS